MGCHSLPGDLPDPEIDPVVMYRREIWTVKKAPFLLLLLRRPLSRASSLPPLVSLFAYAPSPLPSLKMEEEIQEPRKASSPGDLETDSRLEFPERNAAQPTSSFQPGETCVRHTES